jgi:hypothetical protein
MIPTISARRRVVSAVLTGQRHRVRVYTAQQGQQRWSSSSSSSAAAAAVTNPSTSSQQHPTQTQQQLTTIIRPLQTLSANAPNLVTRLERVYEILEAEVGGEEEWSVRVQNAIRRLLDVESNVACKARVAGESLSFVFCLPSSPLLSKNGSNQATNRLTDPDYPPPSK